jgi:TetR/AcrR family transcriptional regulator, cholesterol catabolism regulator
MGLSRQLIIETAMELFKIHGYSATSIKDIANELSCTKAALYYHISSKEEILSEIFDQTMTKAEVRLDLLLQQELSVEQRIRQYIFNQIMSVFDAGQSISIFFSERSKLSNENLQMIDARLQRYESAIAEIFQQGIQQGILKPVEVMPTIYGIIGMCNWLYHWYEPDGAIKPAHLANIYSDMILKGISNE